MNRIAAPWEQIDRYSWHRPKGGIGGSIARIRRLTYGDPLCGICPTWSALGWLPPNRGDSDLWTREYATPAEAQADIDNQLRALGWTVDESLPIDTPPLDVPFIGPLPPSSNGSINMIEVQRAMVALMPRTMEGMLMRPMLPLKIIDRDAL